MTVKSMNWCQQTLKHTYITKTRFVGAGEPLVLLEILFGLLVSRLRVLRSPLLDPSVHGVGALLPLLADRLVAGDLLAANLDEHARLDVEHERAFGEVGPERVVVGGLGLDSGGGMVGKQAQDDGGRLGQILPVVRQDGRLVSAQRPRPRPPDARPTLANGDSSAHSGLPKSCTTTSYLSPSSSRTQKMRALREARRWCSVMDMVECAMPREVGSRSVARTTSER